MFQIAFALNAIENQSKLTFILLVYNKRKESR